MRQRRRELPEQEQESAARFIADTVLNQLPFEIGGHVSLYMAADGEINPRYLMQALLEKGTVCYLPVLQEESVTLAFRQYLPGSELITDSFGLLEPDPSAPEIAPENLSTVFMPLVAFDHAGNRLGMGKGYYDRTFAFLLEGKSGPNLVGLAHECQRVESLQAAAWDVPLRGIITGRQLYLAD